VGKSKLGPSFFTSAGAGLIEERHKENLKPELVSTVVTRSRSSLTAASGKRTKLWVAPFPFLFPFLPFSFQTING
jgi:hypothetical protein